MNTYETNKEKFLKLANDLAIYFPDYLLNTPEGHWNVYFEHKNEPSKGFYLNPNNSTGKFTVSPRIIKHPHYSFGVYQDNNKVNPPEVGFSIREVDKIASGIKTRFLIDFEIYYALWMKTWNEHNDYRNGKVNTIKAVAELLELPETEIKSFNNKGEYRDRFATYHSGNDAVKRIVSDIYVSSSDSIEIKTNYLNIEQVRKLVEFVKTL
jgi:hypothetical protein